MKFDVYSDCPDTGESELKATVEAKDAENAVNSFLNEKRWNANGSEIAVPAGTENPRHQAPLPVKGTLTDEDGTEYEYDFS